MRRHHSWSIALVSPRSRRIRWLSENGRLSSDPRKALRLVDPDVATRRVQEYMAIRGWDVAVMERFRLLPSPQPAEIRITMARGPRPERAAITAGLGDRSASAAAA